MLILVAALRLRSIRKPSGDFYKIVNYEVPPEHWQAFRERFVRLAAQILDAADEQTALPAKFVVDRALRAATTRRACR
jgi:hypothetical protein